MKPFTHTPGDWHTEDGILYNNRRVGGGACLAIGFTCEMLPSDGSKTANAHFLAASPSFPHPCTDKDCKGGQAFNELRDIRDGLEIISRRNDVVGLELKKITALIAKLEGRA